MCELDELISRITIINILTKKYEKRISELEGKL